MRDVPSSSIEAANKSVIAIVESEEGAIKPPKRRLPSLITQSYMALLQPSDILNQSTQI